MTTPKPTTARVARDKSRLRRALTAASNTVCVVGWAILAGLGVGGSFLALLIVTKGAGSGRIALVGVFGGIAGVWLLLRLCHDHIPWPRRGSRRVAAAVGVALSLTLAVSVCLPTVPRARVLPADVSAPFGGHLSMWSLSSGSRVAVYHYPAAWDGSASSPPNSHREPVKTILYIAGGPVRGVPQTDHVFLSQLAKRGFDVWTYDQPGAGRSGLLPSAQYTITRELVDLDDILDRLHPNTARTIDVIGFSAGGSLLVRALADPASAHRIHSAIIAEPGPMDGPTAKQNGGKGRANAARLAPSMGSKRATVTPRYLTALGLEMSGLLPIDNGLVGQSEMLNAFTNADLGANTAAGYCARDAHRIPADDTINTGKGGFSFNPAAALQVQHTIRDAPSIANALRHSTTPAMLVLAECSSQVRSWETTVLADDPAINRVQYLPHVGHHMWNGLDQNNSRSLNVITSYLRGTPSPLPDYPQRPEISAFRRQGR